MSRSAAPSAYTDVTIDLPASAPAELGFQCGMGMYKSKIRPMTLRGGSGGQVVV